MKKRITLYPTNLLGRILIIMLLCNIQAFAQKVTGVVKNTSGVLPGATVKIKGTNTGTIANANGEFEIKASSKDVLIVSFVGFFNKEILVGDQTKIQVDLEEDNKLEEVVVIGYGTQKKTDLTGSVSSINTKDIVGIPNARVDQVLQGRTAGVQITSANGSPGAGTTIRIRGGNSIVGDNEPLWVIDGIIVGQSFNLNNINSNDIKSIDVLKDASSVAIYGSRGANGVILVTTKSGKKLNGGKPEISIGVSTGIQSILRNPAFLTGAEHAVYANEDARIRKTSEPFPNLAILPETDWAGLLIKPASVINVDASINGSSENGKINYYVSGNYYDQDGIVKNSGITKMVYRSNLDMQLSDKVKAGFRLNYAYLNRANGIVSYQQIITSLRERAVRDAAGNYTGIDPISGGPAANLVANAELNINQSLTNNFLSTFYLEYSPMKNLTIRSTFNPEFNNVKDNQFTSSQSPDFLAVGDKGNASIQTLSSVGWNNENTIQYSPTFGKDHSLTLLGGSSIQKYVAESTFLRAFGISSDATTFNNLALGSDPTRNVIGSGYDAFQLISFFGRANYTFKDKYLFTLVGRSDGSSRFAAGNKYAFFPSAAFAWKLSEEPFIKNLNVFQELKLRASYGKSGSQAIDSFRTLAVIEDAKTSYNGVLTSGATLGRPANENLKWETTTQLDIALEASFFKGRLFAEINYYNKNTTDLLLNVRIPRQTGFVSRLENLGEIQNQGLELLLNTVNVSKKDFEWTSTITVSGNRNKVVNLGGVPYIDIVSATGQAGPGGRLLLGQPAPVFIGLNYLGTWKSQDDITASKQVNQIVGGPRFDDPNKNGLLTPDEYYVLGSPQADFIYGFQNNFKYKSFDFSFFIQGTQGNEVFNSLTLNSLFTRGEQTKYAEVLNRWTPTNNTSDIPGGGYLGNVPPNSVSVEDGSHLRLKTMRLAYSLPIKKGGFKKITVYAVGTNLLLFSNYRLIDPESNQFNKNSDNGNVSLGFSSAEYPTAKSYNVGLNFTF